MAQSSQPGGLGWYLDQIRATPLLTAEQERELARRIREDSDPVAREQMIAANLRLVVKIAKAYSNAGMTLGDLVAEGNLGLMRAAEDFDPDAGVRFSTYAAWWIKQSIKRAMINAGQPIAIPAYLNKLITKWRRVSSQLEAKLHRPPTPQELAQHLRISAKRAELVQQGLQAVTAPTQNHPDSPASISESLSDESQPPDQALLDASNSPIVRSLLGKLGQRERKILELRYGLDGYEGPPRTFKEIGAVIGLTRERVRQLEKKALADLRGLAQNLV